MQMGQEDVIIADYLWRENHGKRLRRRSPSNHHEDRRYANVFSVRDDIGQETGLFLFVATARVGKGASKPTDEPALLDNQFPASTRKLETGQQPRFDQSTIRHLLLVRERQKR